MSDVLELPEPFEVPDLDKYKDMLDEYLEAGCAQSKLSEAGWLMAMELYNSLVDHVDLIQKQNRDYDQLLQDTLKLAQNSKPKFVKRRPQALKKRRHT